MRSEGGDRVLFPSRGTDDRNDRSSVTFSFTYGDPDCVLIFSGRNKSLSPRADWIFTMGKLVGGHRRKGPDGGIWLTEGYTGLRSPSHAVWRRLSWAVIDA